MDKQKEVFAGLIPNFEKIFESRISDIDCFIPTQVAKWLITNGAKIYAAVTGIDVDVFLKKTVSIIDRYGNMGASNIPVATSVAMEEGTDQREHADAVHERRCRDQRGYDDGNVLVWEDRVKYDEKWISAAL